ncbi:uncharacterized protein LOC129766377 [Toxorhynchites rutilus septentrionalis]|uniref:uncharacterized protein LOC129766377 n=1 Tax=Toxorhynchites rutilus septentrionalis TaxID=329112 RepID=UPI002479A048|nr:uncharacterized protein LOC129766377 [Toxorhynchites rutilus septentrionalis]
MAPLPATRITPAKVFEHTGLDYCGPFVVRQLAGRGAPVKVWVAVYVCFAVKTVVLDIVAGLSTSACINSLRRFVSRVGRVRVIHCDNSTTFVGASREVKEMRLQYAKQFQSTQWNNECLEKGIEFRFIPPRAPHFGGLWEAAVKSFKYHLVRIMGAAPYHLDELRTAIAQAEGILNSRPLTPVTNHPEDLSVLHSGPSTTSGNAGPKNTSHCCIKWRNKPTEFRVGTMVLLKAENLPPKRWPLGRVVAIYPGVDNIVRVVDVRTSAGIRRRATSELYVLPMESQSESNDAQAHPPAN